LAAGGCVGDFLGCGTNAILVSIEVRKGVSLTAEVNLGSMRAGARGFGADGSGTGGIGGDRAIVGASGMTFEADRAISRGTRAVSSIVRTGRVTGRVISGGCGAVAGAVAGGLSLIPRSPITVLTTLSINLAISGHLRF
jgi:hypothetical protein